MSNRQKANHNPIAPNHSHLNHPSSTISEPSHPDELEVEIPELTNSKDIPVEALAEVRDFVRNEGGITSSQAYTIYSDKFKSKAWGPISQAIQQNAQSLLKQGESLIEPFKAIQGESSHQFQYRRLGETISLVLKQLPYQSHLEAEPKLSSDSIGGSENEGNNPVENPPPSTKAPLQRKNF